MPRFSGKIFKAHKKDRALHLNSKKSTNAQTLVNAVSTSCDILNVSRNKIDNGILLDESTKHKSTSGFRIIDLEILCNVINSSCACSNCGNNTLRLYDGGERDGVVCKKMHLYCDSCQSDITFSTSNVNNWVYEANARLCYAMRCVGVGREGTNLFCGVMNMPPPSTRYTYLNRQLLNALEEECEVSLSSAVQEAVQLNNDLQETVPATDLCVSCDSSWMKRGHTSLHGVSSVISVDTGKIVDLQVMSKHCSVCAVRKPLDSKQDEKKWQEEHKEVCNKNHSGSSGSMEPAGMSMIFNRSQQKYGVRYVKYLGDGDSSAFKTVVDSNPYGDKCKIEKLECVGHIQKRMGGRLLKLKREMKGKKLEDGKPIGGAHRLTDKEIHNLQVYYGKAIRDNIGNVKNMQKAVWAIYFHKLSTDNNPIHHLCDISWCKYKKAQAEGKTYTHQHSLPESVLNAIKPTFRFLAHPDLMKKCSHGKTQNPNESFNQLIWKRCPKTGFASSTVVKIAAFDACLLFNNGNNGRIKVLKRLGFHPGEFSLSIMRDIDSKRIAAADLSVTLRSKEARQKAQTKRKQVAEDEGEAEEYGYGEH